MAPNAPSITASVAGDDVTVVITGTALATHTVLYRKTTAAAWTAGGSRVGDGNMVISDLTPGIYYLLAYSTLSPENSVPGELARVIISGTMNPFDNAMALLAAMLADCVTFAAECDGDAEDFIHLGSDSGNTFPLALISRTGDDNSKPVGTGAVLYGGSLELRLEKAIPTALRTDDAAALTDFGEWIGDIKKELWEQSFLAGGLMLRSADITEGPGRYNDEAHKTICGATMKIQWGFA